MWSLIVFAVYVSVCLLSGLLSARFGASIYLLYGLSQYFMADEDSMKENSETASSDIQNSSLQTAKKSKKKDVTDLKGSKLMKFSLQLHHVAARTHFKEYDEVIMFGILGFSVLLTCDFLHRFTPEAYQASVDKGDLVALLLGTMTLWRTVRNTAQVQWDKASSRRTDISVSLVVGLLSSVLAFSLLFWAAESLVDFPFDSAVENAGKVVAAHLNSRMEEGAEQYPPLSISPTIIKAALAAVAGGISALLLPAALRFVTCYHVAVSEDEKDLKVLERPMWGRYLLHMSVVLPVLTLFLWVKPMMAIFPFSENALDWTRQALLLGTGILHLVLLRRNVQSHLDIGVVSWYNQLHGSMDPDLSYMRARLGLTTHLLCQVTMQFILPGALPLMLLGLSRTRGSHLDVKAVSGAFFFPPALMRKSFIFLAWWSNSIWALFTVVIIAGFRVGRLQAA